MSDDEEDSDGDASSERRDKLRAKNPPVTITLSEEEADALSQILATVDAVHWNIPEETLESVTEKVFSQLEAPEK